MPLLPPRRHPSLRPPPSPFSAAAIAAAAITAAAITVAKPASTTAASLSAAAIAADFPASRAARNGQFPPPNQAARRSRNSAVSSAALARKCLPENS
jgi:hypothetical protein